MSFEIIVPGRFIEGSDPISLPCEMKGRFTLSAVKNGVVTRSLSFDNLILNQGLDRFATEDASGLYRYFYLGTGNTPPAVTDTQLTSIVPGSGNFQRSEWPVVHGGSPDYYNALLISGISTVGQFGNANLSEIGIGGSAPDALFSKELIRDAVGDPTVFPIQDDEQLLASYELRMFPPLADAHFTVDVSGTRDVTVRPVGVNRTSRTATQGGWSLSTSAQVNGSASAAAFFTGDLNGYTEIAPQGTVVSGTGTMSLSPYVPGSYKRDYRIQFASNQSVSNSLRTHLCNTGFGSFQVQYDPPLQKTDQQSMYLDYEFAWARR